MLRPASAGAFPGEDLVLTDCGPTLLMQCFNSWETEVGKALTPQAESVIRDPAFVPEAVTAAEEYGAAHVVPPQLPAVSGAAEASGAAGLFETAGLLPALGSVLSFGVGTVIGSEICHVVGIEGCWYFGSDGADPSPGVSAESEGLWVFVAAAPGSGPSYAWYWYLKSPSQPTAYWRGYGGVPADRCGKISPAAGVSGFVATDAAVLGCTAPQVMIRHGQLYRYAMANRQLRYQPTDDPSVSNYEPGGKPYAAPSNWKEKLERGLTSSPSAAVERVGQRIASKIAGSEVKNPYGTYVEVPNCDGLVYAACTKLLEERGLKPSRENLGWETVTTPTPNEVRELHPARSTEVETGSTVKVVTNPPAEDMPVVIPQPEPNETYSHYAARLNPALTPERHDLEAPYVSPSAGPNAVIDVSPEPETKVDPHGSTTVRVSTNPADAPAPSAAWAPPSVPAVDMSPLSGIPAPCSVFPFGLLCWAGEAVGQFNVTPTCPELNVPLSSPLTSSVSHFRVSPCNSTAEGIMAVARPVFLLLFAVACGFLFARATTAMGGD